MKQISLIILLCFFVVSCAVQKKHIEQEIEKNPAITCSSAQHDLKVLTDEKVSLVGKIASGVTMITPVGLVVGILTGTTGTKFRVTTGKYNDMLDNRIAQIKGTCGL